MKQEKKQYALMLGARSIKPESGMESGHVELTVVEIDEKGEIRNVQYSEFCDLTFYAQWSDRRADTIGESTYAWALEYRSVFSVGLGEATRMAKLLNRADRIAKRFPMLPLSFGQWCSLMASGLGIKRFIKHVGGSGPSFADNEYRTFSIVEGQRVIDQAIADARKVEAAA
jgi:hypothetical protein